MGISRLPIPFYNEAMRRITDWQFGVLWVSFHLLLAVGGVLLIADPMELIDQTNMTRTCDAYIKFLPSVEIPSDLIFALKCWDMGNAFQFISMAIVSVAILLSPLTFAFGLSISRRRRTVP